MFSFVFSQQYHSASVYTTTHEHPSVTEETSLDGNTPPVADAGPDQTAYVNDVIRLDGSGSYDPDAEWQNTTIDSVGNIGKYNSISLDRYGYPHISYHDMTKYDLKYARWNGSAWNIEVVDSAGNVGRYTSIALDSTDYPHISYHDYSNRDLKYARWTGSLWATETLDYVGDVPGKTSLALDSTDSPHISYDDGVDENLKYARWTGSAWDIQTVDSGGVVGAGSSLALDSDNNPHISYHDYSNRDLKYARWTGSGWKIETVDSVGDVGRHTSMVLDNNDHPHISYYDFGNSDLKYAKWTGSSWNIETVDSANSVGTYSSIALESNDNPHISYLKLTGVDLRYATWTGNQWIIETVDSAGSVGGYTSLALDERGNPHISYRDATNDDLRYAKKVGIVSYEWDFGDGSPTGLGERLTHVYPSPGIYNVTLTVTDVYGAVDTDTCTVTILPRNQPPIADANGPYYVDEGSPVTLDGSGSYDPDGDVLQYRWDLNIDGIWDTGWSSGPHLEHTWGDDYSGKVMVQVWDGEFTDTDIANITVSNVAPTVELKILPTNVNVSLRIAGEKWHDVSIELYEDDVLIAEGSFTRYPGSPNDQILDLTHLEVNISRRYSVIVRYTPEDDIINGQPNGANPFWIVLKLVDQEEVWVHHTFNVQHPETHTREVDLTTAILSHGLTFEAIAYDPGADDLTFRWNFGDGTNITDFYPNENKTFPIVVTGIVTHTFPGSATYMITLTVEDDDFGVTPVTSMIVLG